MDIGRLFHPIRLGLMLLTGCTTSCGTVSAVGVAHHRNRSLEEQGASRLSFVDEAADAQDFRLADPVVSPSGIEVAVHTRDTCARSTLQSVQYRATDSSSFDFIDSLSPYKGPENAWAGTGVDAALGAVVLGTVWANSRLNRSLTPAQYVTQRNTTIAITGGVLAIDLAAIGFASSRYNQTAKRTIPERTACSDWRDGAIQSSRASVEVASKAAVEAVSNSAVETVRIDAGALGRWWLLNSLPQLPAQQAVTLHIHADDGRYAAPYEWTAPQARWPPQVPKRLTLTKALAPDDINAAASGWACVALEDANTQATVVDQRVAADTARWIASTGQTCPARSLELQRTFCTKARSDVAALPLFTSPDEMPSVQRTIAPYIEMCDLTGEVTAHVERSVDRLQATAVAATRCQGGEDPGFPAVQAAWSAASAVRGHYQTVLPSEWLERQLVAHQATMGRALAARVKSRSCGTKDDWQQVSLIALRQAEKSGSTSALSRVKSDTRPSADGAVRAMIADEYLSSARSIIDDFTPWYGASWAAARTRQVDAVQRRLDAEAEREAAAARRASSRRSRSSGTSSKAVQACNYCGGTWLKEGVCWFDWNLSAFEKKIRRACYMKNK